MKLPKWAGLVLMVLAAACTERSQPLAVPDPADVDHMYVFRNENDMTDWAYETTDRRRISAILAHLKERNDGYRIETSLYLRVLPWNPAPPEADYEVLLMSPTTTALSFEVGPDWLGGNDGLVKFPEWRRNLNRQRPLGVEEREALVGMLEPQPLGGELRFIHGASAK